MAYQLKYKIHIECLPRLQYFAHLSRGYWKKMQSFCSDYKEELPSSPPDVPSLIRNGKTFLKLRTENSDLYVFETLDDIENERLCDTNNNQTSKGSDIDKEVQSFQKVLLTSKNDKGSIDLMVLDLSNKNKDRLIDVLEKDICEFLENGNRLLMQLKPGDMHIDAVIETGKAIQRRHKRQSFHRRECPRDISQKLEKLQTEGLLGYCLEEDVFNVFVLDKNRQECEKAAFKKTIEEILHPLQMIPKIIWFKKGLEEYFAKPGSMLRSAFNEQNYKEGKFGSVGVFGKTGDGELVFTTAGHVFTTTLEDAYVHRNENIEIIYARNITANDQETQETDSASVGATGSVPMSCCKEAAVKVSPLPHSVKIGYTCANLEESDNCLDFAVIKVDKDKIHMCQKDFPRNMELEENSSIILYERSSANLKGQLVQKVGYESGLTMGIVEFEDVCMNSEDNYLIIKNSDHTKPFVAPGDSGAAVYRIDYIDEHPIAEVISSLIGVCINDKDEFLVCTLRMDKALKSVEDEKNIKVDISNKN